MVKFPPNLVEDINLQIQAHPKRKGEKSPQKDKNKQKNDI